MFNHNQAKEGAEEEGFSSPPLHSPLVVQISPQPAFQPHICNIFIYMNGVDVKYGCLHPS